MNVNDSPRINPSSSLPTIDFHLTCTADDGIRNAFSQLFVLFLELLIFVTVTLRDLEDGDSIVIQVLENLLLVGNHLWLSQSICLRYNWNDVDFFTQSLHEEDVQLRETSTERRDEVQAAVDSVVDNVLSVESRFILEVLLELILNVMLNCLKTVLSIEWISITRSINDGDFQFDSLFNDVQLFLLN